MNKSFPYQPQLRASRDRTRAWLNPVANQREHANTLRKERILGNVKAFIVGCLLGVVIQLVL